MNGDNCPRLLQEYLWNVIAWSKLNNMQLHEQKFEVVNYTLNSSRIWRNLPFTCSLRQYTTSNEEIIEPSELVRDLGVYLSQDCPWTPHITQMVRGAKQVSSWALSVFRDRSEFLMLTLFKTLA